MRFPNFVGPSYVSESTDVDLERTVNLYVEKMEAPGASAQYALYPTPGLVAFASVAQSPGRGLWAQDGRALLAAGYAIHELSSAGVATLRGSVDSDTHPATFSSSGDAGAEVFITSGGKGYIFDLTLNTLSAEIAGLVAHQGGYLDGFFIALDQTASKIRLSALLDGTTWSGIQFQQRNSAPDKWQAMTVAGSYLWLFGSETTDVYYDAGAYPFPLAPVPGALIQQGIAAPFSVANMDGIPVWLSQSKAGSGMVVMANGFNLPARISTHALEFALSGYETISDAIGFTYQQLGHTFYVLKFPTAGVTWVYDATASAQVGFPCWHERARWNTTLGEYDAWGPTFHAYGFGAHLVLDGDSGTVYELSTDAYDDAGTPIRRLRRSPHSANELERLFYDRFQLDLQVGIGLASGQGSDPQVMFRMSRDGGRTWGNERMASAGAIGAYKTRVFWNRLGPARDAVFEISMSDPVPWRLTDAFLQVTAGAH